MSPNTNKKDFSCVCVWGGVWGTSRQVSLQIQAVTNKVFHTLLSLRVTFCLQHPSGDDLPDRPTGEDTSVDGKRRKFKKTTTTLGSALSKTTTAMMQNCQIEGNLVAGILMSGAHVQNGG